MHEFFCENSALSWLDNAVKAAEFSVKSSVDPLDVHISSDVGQRTLRTWHAF